ncbi:MAG TPA: DUF4389 domain-containing protein [Solirubrobacteraceae bacterium]|nr:DUF4389 domain-containing protein [Solirubrobacteraceae bacterium]
MSISEYPAPPNPPAGSEHAVRLLITDDLQRDRLTVFFRLILSIPHFIWFSIWGIATLVLGVVNWFATLIGGQPPAGLHRLIAAYVKYATHFHAYLHLAANPYPRFDGRPGYPIDLEIAPPAPQNRWTVGFRGVLMLPALLIAAALNGNPNSGAGGRRRSFSYTGGLLASVAFLGWFAILARRAMPRGLRDGAAYALCYGAQFWSYALLLTDRYPDSDPLAAVPDLPVRSDPIRLELDDDLRRSRLTVFFRLLLTLPHLIWLGLWAILALLGVILNWFATLFAGRSPEWLHRFLAAYLRYANHVYSFLYLVANPFPGFVGKAGSYPFEIAVAPRERQNRWKTGFRIVLAIPALILAGAYAALVFVVAVLGWFSSLARGRMPMGLRNAGALALRYQAQAHGYLLLLSEAYPYSGPVRAGAAPRSGLPGAPGPPEAPGPPDAPGPSDAPGAAGAPADLGLS